jgi:transposase
MESSENIILSRAEFEKILREKDHRIAFLEQELSQLKRMIFGAKSERHKSEDPMQLNLFNLAAEKPVDPEVKEKEEISYTRNKPNQEKKQPLRLALPSHLRREVEILEPENLPAEAKVISEKITEVLEYIPGELYVRQIKRPVYKLESTTAFTDPEIKVAELPSLPIPKGNAGASLLSYLIISKYVDHLPFYRQVQMFKRQNVVIAESTVNGWFSSAVELLMPLGDLLRKKIVGTDYLMADETPIPVLTQDKPGATHKGYLWVYYDPVRKLVLFDYRQSRSREGPNEILKEFKGYLQTDGYIAYDNLENRENIIPLACMAHARRKFEHALDNDKERSEKALGYFKTLYAVESHARELGLSPDQIKELRQEKSIPVLDEMEAWLKEDITYTLPKSGIGKAFEYNTKLWPRLRRYVEDGRLQIDNNLIENSIRPVALGRKNYLFAGSHEGAKRMAMIYSLLATCKIRNIEPSKWLTKTLNTISDYKANKLYELLPESQE